MKPTFKLSLAAVVCAALLGLSSLVIAHDMEGMEMSDSGDASGSGGASGMGKHLMIGAHMTMTPSRPETAADAQRGEQIIATMRRVLMKYQDSDAAVAAGYIPFMPTVPQDVYHFANRDYTVDEYRGDVNLERPGSLLYEKKTFGGYKLVGAMYSAPASYTLDQLNAIIPLSLTHWHEHTNICLPAGITEEDVMNGKIHVRPTAAQNPMGFRASSDLRARFGYMADPRFGFTGTISTESDCETAGGSFHPRIFGWMVHVYPFQSDDLKVAFSTEAP
jgi:hypothetical protein